MLNVSSRILVDGKLAIVTQKFTDQLEVAFDTNEHFYMYVDELPGRITIDPSLPPKKYE